MGTPKSVYQREPVAISVAEATRSSVLAQNIALTRTEEKREAALEQLRKWLAPMVSWFDKPLTDLLSSKKEKKVPGGKVRILTLFRLDSKRQGLREWLGIDRDGDWVLARFFEDPFEDLLDGRDDLYKMSAEEVERLIWDRRKQFLEPVLRHHVDAYEKDVVGEDPTLLHFTQHAVFLGFVSAVVKVMDEMLKVREERLQVLRENVTVIGRYVTALDPLIYRVDAQLPEYGVFSSRPGHYGRLTGDYFAKPCAEAHRAYRLGRYSDPSAGKDEVINDSSVRIPNTMALLGRIELALHDTKPDFDKAFGACSRAPIDHRERRALVNFIEDVQLDLFEA